MNNSQVQKPVPETSAWMGRNVMVTGCTGLLGAWLARSLVKKGATVVGVVRDTVPQSNFYRFGLQKTVRVATGTIEDFSFVERVINEYEVDTVFHLAAQAIVGTANRNPLSTFETNIRGTWNILEACRNNKKIKRVVVASSDKAYGDNPVLPYREDHPLNGMHPYDVSKTCTDLLCATYYNTYGLPVCITRCGNIFGGGDLNFNRIIPGTIQSLLQNSPPVIRSDGTFVRDYIYVQDIVNAYLVLAERMDDPRVHGEAFNFSNEQPMNVIELVGLVITLMGCNNHQPVILNESSHEIKNQFLSAEKARTVLGWKSLYTLEEGLTETIGWYRDYSSIPAVP